MTSKIKVDNINKVSDDTNIIKRCGTTTTVGSGASNTIVIDGSTVTLGRCGGTVALASGATQTGFGRTGTVNWQTSSIKTATFTAANGEGYFCNTQAGAFNITLPSSPTAGDIVALKDYNGTFSTNNLTIDRNGSPLNGASSNFALSTNFTSMTLVYVDGTEGWMPVEEGTGFIGENFIEATGGTESTCGNDKIHTFTGPGTFTVCVVGDCSSNNQVSYIVVAGGGGGATRHGGGGGAGGFREDKSPVTPYTASPLEGAGPITVTATSFPITVGGGGPGASCSPGSNSVFSTITSAGGGGSTQSSNGSNGGSGGGGGGSVPGPVGTAFGGNGNTPPVSPSQGFPGGPNTVQYNGGGGGGASAAGASPGPTAGVGGAGVTTSINGSSTAFAGGGGGGSYGPQGTPKAGGAGGSGGGGAGATGNPPSGSATAGTVNTGGGGGGGAGNDCTPQPCASGAGGSGIVIIRYKFQ